MNSPETLKKFFVAGLHFGHKTSKWNPKMAPYIFGEKNGIHIFDLEKTAEGLQAACDFLEDAASEGKTILFVSTKQQTSEMLPDMAASLGMPYVTVKWFGGLLTNWETTKARLRELRDLKRERDENDFAKYLKKERNQKIKQIEKLESWLSGIENMQKKPDVVFVLDTVRDAIAVREARKCGIPVVGMLDSNSNPDLVDVGIPGNDDAVKAIQLILAELHDAVEHGIANPKKKETKKEAAAEKAEKKTEEKSEK